MSPPMPKEAVLLHAVEQRFCAYWLPARRRVAFYAWVPGPQRMVWRRSLQWPITKLHANADSRTGATLQVKFREPGTEKPRFHHPGCHCRGCRGTNAAMQVELTADELFSVVVGLDRAMEQGRVAP